MDSRHENMAELLDEFFEQEKIFRWEGETGLKNLEKVIEAIGYGEHSFKRGDLISVFLKDNPGAINAIIDWISAQFVDEWMGELESRLYDESYGEEDE